MTKKDLCELLNCTQNQLDSRLNSNKEIDRDIFRVLLNMSKEELIYRIYNINMTDSNTNIRATESPLNIIKTTNIEQNIDNLINAINSLKIV